MCCHPCASTELIKTLLQKVAVSYDLSNAAVTFKGQIQVEILKFVRTHIS